MPWLDNWDFEIIPGTLNNGEELGDQSFKCLLLARKISLGLSVFKISSGPH